MGTNYFITPPLGWRENTDTSDRSEYPNNPVYTLGDIITLHYLTNFTSSTCFLFQDFAKKGTVGERVFGPVKPDAQGHQRFNWTVDTGNFDLTDANVFFFVVSSPKQDLIYSHYFNVTGRGSQPASVISSGNGAHTATLPITEPVDAPRSGLKLPVVLGLVGGILAGLSLFLLGGFFVMRYYRQGRANNHMQSRRKSRTLERKIDLEGVLRPETVKSSGKRGLGSFYFDFEVEPKASGARPVEPESDEQKMAVFRVFTKASGKVIELTQNGKGDEK